MRTDLEGVFGRLAADDDQARQALRSWSAVLDGHVAKTFSSVCGMLEGDRMFTGQHIWTVPRTETGLFAAIHPKFKKKSLSIPLDRCRGELAEVEDQRIVHVLRIGDKISLAIQPCPFSWRVLNRGVVPLFPAALLRLLKSVKETRGLWPSVSHDMFSLGFVAMMERYVGWLYPSVKQAVLAAAGADMTLPGYEAALAGVSPFSGSEHCLWHFSKIPGELLHDVVPEADRDFARIVPREENLVSHIPVKDIGYASRRSFDRMRAADMVPSDDLQPEVDEAHFLQLVERAVKRRYAMQPEATIFADLNAELFAVRTIWGLMSSCNMLTAAVAAGLAEWFARQQLPKPDKAGLPVLVTDTIAYNWPSFKSLYSAGLFDAKRPMRESGIYQTIHDIFATTSVFRATLEAARLFGFPVTYGFMKKTLGSAAKNNLALVFSHLGADIEGSCHRTMLMSTEAMLASGAFAGPLGDDEELKMKLVRLLKAHGLAVSEKDYASGSRAVKLFWEIIGRGP